MSGIRPGWTAQAIGVALAALLSVAIPAVAQAAPKSMAGFVGGALGGGSGTFLQPRDVAIYEGVDGDPSTDKIFVVEAANANMRIQRLDVHGNFERMWGRNVDGVNPSLGAEICTVAANCQAPSTNAAAVGALAGEFDDPTGLAVDQVNGWVYVYDRDNARVQKFDVNGNFILMFGKGVNVTTIGDICTQANLTVDGHTCGAGAPGAGAAQIGATSTQVRGLAVNPVSGDVTVADPQNRRILQFGSNGAFQRGWGWDVDKTTVDNRFETCTATCGAGVASSPANANGAFAASSGSNGLYHVAVDSSGIVYASDAAPTTSTQRILRFDSVPAPAAGDATTSLATAIASPPLLSSGTTPTVGLEIDADTDGGGTDEEHLLVVRDPSSGLTVVQEFDIPANPSDPITVGQLFDTHSFAAQPVNGIGVNSARGLIYLPVSLTGGFSQCSLDTGATSCVGLIALAGGPATPDATIGTPSAADADSAVLNGNVDPNGSLASYQFEVSDSGADDDWDPVGAPGYASGGSPIVVSALADGLQSNTVYRTRLVVKRYDSLTSRQVVESSESIFVTDAIAPEATTIEVSPRRTDSATLQARINPNGSPTTYFFEYGTSTGYGQRAPVPSGGAGSGGMPRVVHEGIDGLQPATTYHYRVVAENAIGTSVGSDRSFTTRSPQTADPTRGQELASTKLKASGPGVGGHGNNSQLDGEFSLYTTTPSYSGDRALSRTGSGPVLDGGAAVFVNDFALSERTPSGWSTETAFNRPNYSTLASVPFLDLVATNGALSLMTFDNTGGSVFLFPEMDTAAWYAIPQGAGTKYLRNWDGAWEPIQPTAPTQGSAGSGGETVGLAADGGTAAFTNALRGVTGGGDPSLDQVGGRATYLQDVSIGLSDTFAGSPRSLIGVCTGTTVGGDRTLIPERLPSGKFAAQACPPAIGGRDAALTNSRGAAIAATNGRNHAVRNVVSENGSRVFFMSPDPAAGPATCAATTGTSTNCPAQLFVSQRDGSGPGRTVRWVSRPAVANQDASLLGPAYFEGASDDGDKVFFRTTTPLTADDPNGEAPIPGGVTSGTASASSWDLYMYDFPDSPGSDPGSGTLTRVTAGPTGTADSNLGVTGNIGGALRFASVDGQRLYFTTAGPIPGVSTPSNGTTTEPVETPTSTSTSNLYYYDSSEPLGSRWHFVTLLPRSTSSEIDACASTAAGPGQSRVTTLVSGSFLYDVASTKNCFRGTDDGRFVTFWTTGRIVANDPHEASGDMYAFEAASDALTRLSEPQGGSGGTYVCDTSDVTPVSCNGDPGFTTGEPDRWRNAQLGVATDPEIAGDHIAFFESRSRLVPQDSNEDMDVYKWHNGELTLVTSGEGDNGTYYSGNDVTGRTVFAVTADVLSWEDQDAVRDVYAFRVGGGFDQPLPAVVCGVLDGACQGDGGAPVLGASDATLVAGGEGASPTRRIGLRLSKPSARDLRKAARTGRLPVTVKLTRAGRVSVLAKARLGGKLRTVARDSKRISAAGSTKLVLRLGPAARRQAQRRAGLRLTLRASAPESRTRTMTVRLKGARS